MMTVATMFAANHVSARLAFDNGTGLLLAVLMRSGVACLILLSLVILQKKAPLAACRNVALAAGGGATDYAAKR